MRADYLPYIGFSNLCIDDSALLLWLERLISGESTEKNLGISHFHGSVLYRPELDDVELMIDSAVYFTKIPNNGALFTHPFFYSGEKSTHLKLR